MRTKEMSLALLALLSCVVAASELRAQEDRFVVFGGGKHGYIDKQGKLVIPIVLQGTYVVRFKERRALFAERVTRDSTRVPHTDENGKLHMFPQDKWGFIDEAGTVVIPAQFFAAEDFSEGLAAVAVATQQTQYNCVDCDLRLAWGFVDMRGNIVVKPQYRSVSGFSQGLAAAENDDGKWGYIDPQGHTAIPFSFDRAYSFSEGLAAAAIKQKFGYVNKAGAFVITRRFARASEFSGGLAAVRVGGKTDYMIVGSAGGTWVYISEDGQTRIRLPHKTDRAERFSEGLAVFEIGGECGYVGANGKVVIPPIYSFCEDFSEGLAAVSRNGGWQYIDQSGGVALTTFYFSVGPFKNGLAEIEQGSVGPEQRFGYIDRTGNVVWKPQRAL